MLSDSKREYIKQQLYVLQRHIERLNSEVAKDLYELLTEYSELPYEYLPESYIEKLEQDIISIVNELNNKGNREVQEKLYDFQKILEFYLPTLQILKEKFLPIAKNFEKTEKNLEEKIKTIEALIKDYAAKAAVGEHKNYFQGEADLLSTRARKWLNATIWFGSATLGLAIIFSGIYYLLPFFKIEINLLQYISSKILIVGILLTATIWCGRNYKTLMHQFTLNSQKAIALNTFRTFIESTHENTAIKEAIILETTKFIFSLTNTGYLDGETQNDGGLRIFELIKNIKTNG